MALTEEQKLRMEENKRKALERRKQSQIQAQGKTEPSKFYQNAPKKPSTSTSSNFPKPSNSNNFPSSPNRQKIVGKCILIPKKRFEIDIKYQNEVIEIFKKSKTGSYNAKERTWNFKVEEHDDLLGKLRPLQKQLNVFIEALPRWILETFKTFQASLIKESDVDLSQVEPTLLDSLMPFQRDAVIYALQRKGRILLADDMGLGKTIQALAIASVYKSDWPLLIVCPSSVRFAWKSAVIRWLPSVPEEDVTVVTSGKDDLEGQIIIISYDLLNRKQEELMKYVQPSAAILDESHLIKGSKTARTKAAEMVLKNCSRILLLSGTPALSRPIELYSQICLIDCKLFPYVTDFGMRYCDGKKVNFGPNKSHYDFQGSSNMEELRILMLERFMIRRLKSEVLTQLPSKERQMIVLDPSLVKSKSREMQSQAKLMSNKSLSKSERRGILLEWFHSTANAKSLAVQDYIKDLVEMGHKFICFAHHNTMMNDIAETLDKAKVHFIRIDGSTNSNMRKFLTDAFQTDDKVRVALLSITAANSGLTLTAAQLVVFAELFWNPGILTQAEDRAHRIGQTDSVTVQYLVATGTADDELWPLIQKKLDVLNKAGLSKDNFMESECVNKTSEKEAKITDFFSTSLTEEDMAALDQDWDEMDENEPQSQAKKRKL